MASILRRKTGSVAIQFVDTSGMRRTLALGANVPERFVKRSAEVVADLVAAATYGTPVDADVLAWLDGLKDDQHARFVAAGLAHSREKREAATLGAFLDRYIERRTDLKGGTLVFYSHTVENLKRFFGDDRRLEDVTPAEADDFRRWLGTDDASRQNPKGKRAKRDTVKPLKRLAVATINRRCVAARTIFRDALRRKLIGENPFSGVGAGPKANPERSRYITPETIAGVLEACPHDEWRLLVALSRFAGLRIPSEALTLTWDDVNWAENRLTVHSPKTEHHAGKAQRTIPLFPEVRVYFDRLWTVAPEGSKSVFSQLQRVAQHSETGWKSVNLRTTFLKIVKRAGAEPWPRVFHNMRASAQTDLEQRFPSYVVCAWLGNSETVAKAHYLQVLPEHFESALHGALHGAAKLGEMGGGSLVQKHEKTRISAGFSRPGMGGTGFEPVTSTV
jgi:integrase